MSHSSQWNVKNHVRYSLKRPLRRKTDHGRTMKSSRQRTLCESSRLNYSLIYVGHTDFIMASIYCTKHEGWHIQLASVRLAGRDFTMCRLCVLGKVVLSPCTSFSSCETGRHINQLHGVLSCHFMICITKLWCIIQPKYFHSQQLTFKLLLISVYSLLCSCLFYRKQIWHWPYS